MSGARTASVTSTFTPELAAVLESIRDIAKGAAADAREARDGVNRIENRLSGENHREEIAQLWAKLNANEVAARTDNANTYDKIMMRVLPLEADKAERDGAKGWRQGFNKAMPWLVAIAALALSVASKFHG